MELMSHYDAKIVYIEGNDNSVANALSHFPNKDTLKEAENLAWHPYSYCSDEDDTLHTVASVAVALAQSQLKPKAKLSLAEAQPELLSDGSHISANSGSG